VFVCVFKIFVGLSAKVIHQKFCVYLCVRGANQPQNPNFSLKAKLSHTLWKKEKVLFTM
jgi:hypothetical protein